MLRDLAIYGAFITILAVAAYGIRVDEGRLPQQSTFPWPELEIDGLSVAASQGLPEFSAREARPEAGTALKIGGWHDHLGLRAVTVVIGEGCGLVAEAGEYSAGRLLVSGRVRVVVDGQLRLEASRVVFANGQARFAGAAVFHSAAGRESVVDLSMSLRTLARKLR